jgi:hypothetical protein
LFLIPKNCNDDFSSGWRTPELLVSWGCQIAPFDQLPLGFRFKMVEPGFCPASQAVALKAIVILVQNISDHCFPHLFVCNCQHLWHPTGTDLGKPSSSIIAIKLPLLMDRMEHNLSVL